MSKIRYTQHAFDVIVERKLAKELVESTVLFPEWEEKGSSEVWSAFKRVGKKVLRVVAKGKRAPFTVITAYYDRRRQ